MKRSLWITPLLVLLLAVGSPLSASADADWTPTVQTAFDKLTAGSDSLAAGRLKTRYQEFVRERDREKSADADIKAVRYRADELRIAVNKRMKERDAAKLAALDKQLAELKTKRQPLFDAYTRLNRQLSLARSLKSKPAIAVAKAQADALKIPAQLAREEIRRKEAEVKKAKDERTAHLKKVRAVLAENDSLALKLKAERSAATAAGKIVTAENKVFSAAVRKADAAGALASLTRLASGERDAAAAKLRVLELERKSLAVVERAAALLPAQ